VSRVRVLEAAKEPKGATARGLAPPPWAMAGRVGRHPVLRAYITPLTPPAVVMMPTGTDRHGEDAGLGSKRNRQEQQRNSQIAHSTYPLSSSDEEGGGSILEGDAARLLHHVVRSLFISTSRLVGLLSHLCRNALLILQGSPCGFDSPLCRLEAVCLPPGVTLQCLGNLGRLVSLSGGVGLMPDIYLPRRLFAPGRNSRSGERAVGGESVGIRVRACAFGVGCRNSVGIGPRVKTAKPGSVCSSPSWAD
jgi:hypothetical protein